MKITSTNQKIKKLCFLTAEMDGSMSWKSVTMAISYQEMDVVMSA